MSTPISLSLHEAVAVETTKKSQDTEKESRAAMNRLIESLEAPKSQPPPEGSTVSVKA